MSGRFINQSKHLNLLKSLLQSESAVSLYFQRMLLLLDSLEARELTTNKKHSKILKKARFHIETILKTVQENRRILTRKIELILGEGLQGEEPWCIIQTVSMPSCQVPSQEVTQITEPDLSLVDWEESKMKVAVLTAFSSINPKNELVQIIYDQLKMLLDAGMPTKVLVSKECLDNDRYGIFLHQNIEWVKIKTRVDGEKRSGVTSDIFYHEAKVIAADLVDKLSDVDVCILHDILNLEEHLLLNLGVRIAQKELKGLRFIAFTHSLPEKRPANIKSPFSARYTPMLRTVYVHPTFSALPALSRQFQVAEGKCRVVNCCFDMLEGLTDEVRIISGQVDLLSPDFLMIYPAYLAPEKQFEKVARFAGVLKKVSEKTVRVIFCDFPITGIDARSYKEKIVSTGLGIGLEPGEIIFTSDLGFSEGITRQGILDLFSLSNLYVCPSLSETLGLTVLEAASRGNFIILNEAVPLLVEIGKTLNAYFMKWDSKNISSDANENDYSREQKYLEEHMNIITDLIREDRVIQAKTITRQRYSLKWIWKNHLEPILDF